MTVTRDAVSGWVIPQSAAEWTSLLTGTGLSNPAHLWLCQEASGTLADTIGSATLTLFGAGSYQQAVTGWSTTAVRLNGVNDSFYATSILDLSANSAILFGFIKINAAPASPGQLFGIGNSSGGQQRRALVSAAPVYEVGGDGGQATGAGASDPRGSVRPVCLRINRAAGYIKLTTDQETVTAAYTAPAGSGAEIDIGNNAIGTYIDASFLYLALWSGSAAEMADSDIAMILDLMGPPAVAAPPRWGSASGLGSPVGVFAAPVGTIYRNLIGGVGTTLWIKELGSGTTGWSPLVSGDTPLDGSNVGPVAFNNVIGGIPVVHIFDIADAASADYDLVLTDKTEIYDAVLVKTGSNGTGNVTVQNGSTQILDALLLSNSQYIQRPLQLVTAANANVIAAAGTLRCSVVRTTGDGACRVYVYGVRSS